MGWRGLGWDEWAASSGHLRLVVRVVVVVAALCVQLLDLRNEVAVPHRHTVLRCLSLQPAMKATINVGTLSLANVS